jgi:hypothetical protein
MNLGDFLVLLIVYNPERTYVGGLFPDVRRPGLARPRYTSF